MKVLVAIVIVPVRLAFVAFAATESETVPLPLPAAPAVTAIHASLLTVKQKDKAGRPDIDSFEAMMTRSDRTKGFFVSFDYSSDAIRDRR